MNHPAATGFMFGASKNVKVPKKSIPPNHSSEVAHQKYFQQFLRPLQSRAYSRITTLGIGMKYLLLRAVKSSAPQRKLPQQTKRIKNTYKEF